MHDRDKKQDKTNLPTIEREKKQNKKQRQRSTASAALADEIPCSFSQDLLSAVPTWHQHAAPTSHTQRTYTAAYFQHQKLFRLPVAEGALMHALAGRTITILTSDAHSMGMRKMP